MDHLISLFIVWFSVINPLFTQEIIAIPDRQEAKAAFEYLNRIRQDPAQYKDSIGEFMGSTDPAAELQWNDTLAELAEKRALDMAKRKYFDHVTPEGKGINIMLTEAGYKLDPDWIKDISSNSFESIYAGAKSCKEAIYALIIDDNVPGKGHRKHLLGMTEWYGMLRDIGIGYVKCDRDSGARYISYTCIIIAIHGW